MVQRKIGPGRADLRIPINSRSVALELLNKVTNDDSYANLVMPALLDAAKLEKRDAAFAQELAFSTLRWQLTYDAILDSVSSRPVLEIDATLLNALRLGCHQLLQMRVPAHAALNETVQLIRHACGERMVGFANGLLRRVSEKSLDQWLDLIESKAKTDVERLSLRYSHPQWIVRALQQSLQSDGRTEDIDDLLRINNVPALVNLVSLPGLSNRDDFTDVSESENRYSPFGFTLESGNPADLVEIKKGSVRVQDEGSQLAALALASFREIESGENWLDMCAGPGGKAALLAAIAEIEGVALTANEVQPHRAELVRKALKSFPAVDVTVKDGREFANEAKRYDRILVDAPCTGLGALRRRPEARWRKAAEDLKTLTDLQFELISSAYEALKPGGLLLYVTCSPHLSETTAIIEKASRKLGATVLDLTTAMNNRFMAGTLPVNRKTIQLFTQRDNTDCMFMAMLTK
ncbi:MAG: rRNA small subunit methyltransferase B [Micrococcales bacterium]|nr:rRNA small subunit methyltransferase B [Micrococcales bacterium]